MIKNIRNKLFVTSIIMFIGLMLISLTSADSQIQSLGSFNIGTNPVLLQNCVNSTYANISRIVYVPNSSIIVNSNLIMTKSGYNYNYTFNNASAIGDYYVYGYCDENGVLTNWVYSFTIGRTLSLPQALIYLALLITSGLLTYGFYVFARNKQENVIYDKLGYISKVDYGKSLKLFLFAISYLFLIWFIWIAYQISYAFIPIDLGITNVLYIIWLVMFWSLLPLLIIWFIALILLNIRTFITNAKAVKGYRIK